MTSVLRNPLYRNRHGQRGERADLSERYRSVKWVFIWKNLL